MKNIINALAVVAGLFLFVVVMLGQTMRENAQVPTLKPRAKIVATVPASAPVAPVADALDNEREAFIKKLINELRVFDSVTWRGDVTTVVVGPEFDALRFDLKQKFVNVVYAQGQSNDPPCKIVVLRDRLNNQTIGRYGVNYGGLKMD